MLYSYIENHQCGLNGLEFNFTWYVQIESHDSVTDRQVTI